MESIVVFGLFFLICIGYIPKSDRAYLDNNMILKKHIVWVLAFTLFLIGALRNPNTGVDTRNYYMYFTTWRVGLSISSLLKEAFSSIASQQGYAILERVFYKIIPNGQAWLAFLCIVFLVPCSILIYRFSDCPPVSFIYLVASTIYTFSWQGLKQTVAMSICLFAFICLIKRQRVLYLLLIFIAFQFHKSSIVFLLALPASYLKVERWDFAIIIFAFLIARFSPTLVIDVISGFLDMGFYDKLEGYITALRGSTFTMFFILLILYLGCYRVKQELINGNPINKILFNMSIVGIAFQAMAVIVAEFFRVSYYFSIFNMLLVANAGQLAWEKHPQLKLRFMMIAFMIFIFFGLGGFDYWFFFQNRLV